MAEPEVRITGGALEVSDDIEMQGGEDLEVAETGAADAPIEEDEEIMPTEKTSPRITFVE